MKSYYKLALLFTWMLAIFLLSSEVSDVSSGRSSMIVGVIESLHVSLPQELLTFITRKSAHIFMYFILGILMAAVVGDYISSGKKRILVSITFVLTYAASDEFHQLFVAGRSGELRDVLIDTAAGLIGIVLFYLAFKKKNTPRP